MCTAASYQTSNHYFGRNLDLSFPQTLPMPHGHTVIHLPTSVEIIAITPRNFPFHFREAGDLSTHYAIIGIAQVIEGFPLYYDAVNEKGLGIAGLNFPGNAAYQKKVGTTPVASFELIPWLLGTCETVAEAKLHLQTLSITDTPFSSMIPPAPLHWIISDKTASITVEVVEDGVHIYENPALVLTNNPPFAMQMMHLTTFMTLSPQPPVNTFSTRLSLKPFCQGMGALGLPGDFSSPSRFVKAAFTLLNSPAGSTEREQVSQFFHILDSVSVPRGSVVTKHRSSGDEGGTDTYEYTVYTTCYNTDRGTLYYTTYENSQISAVDMHRTNLDSADLICYPMIQGQQVHWQN